MGMPDIAYYYPRALFLTAIGRRVNLKRLAEIMDMPLAVMCDAVCERLIIDETRVDAGRRLLKLSENNLYVLAAYLRKADCVPREEVEA